MDKNNIEIRSLVQIFLILTFTYLFFSILFSTTTPRKYMGCNYRRRECELCEPYMLNNSIEEFENAQNTYEPISKFTSSYSKTQTYKYYQYASLNAPSLEGEAPSNLMFGEIKKYNRIKNGKNEIIINLSANLYVLDGNVYNEKDEKVTQFYKAYLYNSTDKTQSKFLGILKRDGDGLYKLNITSDDMSLNEFDSIMITHKLNDKETIILSGQF